MDERMMTLFSFIADQVQNKQELFEKEGKIMEALLNHGCVVQEADAAITLMQALVQTQADGMFGCVNAPVSMRTMNREERERFTIEAFGFVTKLTNLGIVSADQREDLLEQALTVCPGRIELDEIKTLVAFTLFSNPQKQDSDAFEVRRYIKKHSWN